MQIKNIPTGAGDDPRDQCSVLAKGNTKDVISTSGGSPSFAMFGGTGGAGAYQSVGGATSTALAIFQHRRRLAVNGIILTKA